LGNEDDAARFSFNATPEKIAAWRSRALCTREPATVLKVSGQVAVIDLSTTPRPGTVETVGDRVVWQGHEYRLVE
jgi:hypothetical protein